MHRADACQAYSGHGVVSALEGHRLRIYEVAIAISPHSLGGKLPWNSWALRRSDNVQLNLSTTEFC